MTIDISAVTWSWSQLLLSSSLFWWPCRHWPLVNWSPATIVQAHSVHLVFILRQVRTRVPDTLATHYSRQDSVIYFKDISNIVGDRTINLFNIRREWAYDPVASQTVLQCLSLPILINHLNWLHFQTNQKLQQYARFINLITNCK